jgi:predicted phosphatase
LAGSQKRSENMKVTVVKAEPHMWYSNMIGQTFEVIKANTNQYIFSLSMFFFSEDVIETPEIKNGLVTSLNLIGIS